MKKLGTVAIGAALVGAGWCGSMASGCSTAHADPFSEVAPPEVIELECKVIDSVNFWGASAQRAFPGRTAADLSRATAMIRTAAYPDIVPETSRYAFETTSVLVKDGSILVRCNGEGKVTLVVPPAL